MSCPLRAARTPGPPHRQQQLLTRPLEHRSGLHSAAQAGRSAGRARAATWCRAELLAGGGMLDTVVTWGALGLSAGGVAYSLFYAWPSQRRGQPGSLTGEEDNFTWAVMGAVSALPLFNSMAWVLGALQAESPRPFYWAAALYALPLLRNGFDQDAFSIAMLLLGAAHVQALRIGATEPALQAKLQQQLKPLAVVTTLADAAVAATSAAIGSGSSSRQRLSEGGGREAATDALQAQQEEAGLGEDAAYQQQQQEELRAFDRRLEQQARQRQQ